jgi:DNA-binding response OmpR family regulator
VVTQREYALLVHLASDPDRVFTKEDRLRALWGAETFGATRTLDSQRLPAARHAVPRRQPLVDHQRLGCRLRLAPRSAGEAA